MQTVKIFIHSITYNKQKIDSCDTVVYGVTSRSEGQRFGDLLVLTIIWWDIAGIRNVGFLIRNWYGYSPEMILLLVIFVKAGHLTLWE